MPQQRENQKRTHAEEKEFERMLLSINIIFLGCTTLVVCDMQYVGRFWASRADSNRTLQSASDVRSPTCEVRLHLRQTQFEFWAATQVASASGLSSGLRKGIETAQQLLGPLYLIRCIHSAPQAMQHTLEDMWAHKTPEQAAEALSKDDVLVTNKRDKTKQLKKLKKLNEDCIQAYADIEGWRRPVELAARSVAEAMSGSLKEIDVVALESAICGAKCLPPESLDQARNKLAEARRSQAMHRLALVTAPPYNYVDEAEVKVAILAAREVGVADEQLERAADVLKISGDMRLLAEQVEHAQVRADKLQVDLKKTTGKLTSSEQEKQREKEEAENRLQGVKTEMAQTKEAKEHELDQANARQLELKQAVEESKGETDQAKKQVLELQQNLRRQGIELDQLRREFQGKERVLKDERTSLEDELQRKRNEILEERHARMKAERVLNARRVSARSRGIISRLFASVFGAPRVENQHV
jgi:hypothetical protein